MANPIIFWDDDTVSLVSPTVAEIENEDRQRGSGIQAPASASTIKDLVSPRTDTTARASFAVKLLASSSRLYTAVFAHDTESKQTLSRYETKRGTYLTIGAVPSGQSVYILAAGSASGVTSIISSTNRLELAKPSQSGVYPDTASESWQLYPEKSSIGGYFGANARRTHGSLKIEIDELPIAWIEKYWEPLRSHLAQGGVVVYAVDFERQPNNIALCYAKKDIAPKILSGGFGSVNAELGIATIIDRSRAGTAATLENIGRLFDPADFDQNGRPITPGGGRPGGSPNDGVVDDGESTDDVAVRSKALRINGVDRTHVLGNGLRLSISGMPPRAYIYVFGNDALAFGPWFNARNAVTLSFAIPNIPTRPRAVSYVAQYTLTEGGLLSPNSNRITVTFLED